MIAKNIYEMLHDVCTRNKDSIFFVRENETYAELLKKVKQRAVLLAKRFKIKKGDTVAILSGNTPDFLRTYFAITSQGARVLMLDTGLQTSEHINMMKRTNCKLTLAQKHYFIDDAPSKMFDIENIDDTDENEFVMADTERSDIAQLSFTSGSTGNPKVVGLTHENLLSLSDGAQFYKDVIFPGYTFYGFLPLYHIYGVVINIIVPVSLQGKLLLQPVLKPQEFIKDFKQYKPEVIPAVPRIWEVFYKKIADTAREKHVWTLMRVIVSLRHILRAIGLGGLVKKVTKPVHDAFGGNTRVLVSAGATLKPTIRKFYERMGFVVGDCYGLTETCGPANFNFAFRRPDGSMYYAGPLPGNEIQIHNPNKDGIGEIWVKGDMVMQGYYNSEDDGIFVDEEGKRWVLSGDLGYVDEDGYFFFTGRKKRMIIISGYNVYPADIENAVLQLPFVSEACAVQGYIKNKDRWKAKGEYYDSCLAALQLMVYYRYLPTTQASAGSSDHEDDESAAMGAAVDKNKDVDVNVVF